MTQEEHNKNNNSALTLSSRILIASVYTKPNREHKISEMNETTTKQPEYNK